MASWIAVLISGVAIAFAVALALTLKKQSEGIKKSLFAVIVVFGLGCTLFLTGMTIWETSESVTKGPVHWHADYQIFRCGFQIDIINPAGLSNRVGTPVLHEHGDNRIHVEGTVDEMSSVNLASFFAVVGGELRTDQLVVPTYDGHLLTMRNGDRCPDGRQATLQTFVYTVDGDVLSQAKLENAPEYILSPEALVPPADCIIFEFSPESLERTEHLCPFHQIAVNKGELNLETAQ